MLCSLTDITGQVSRSTRVPAKGPNAGTPSVILQGQALRNELARLVNGALIANATDPQDSDWASALTNWAEVLDSYPLTQDWDAIEVFRVLLLCNQQDAAVLLRYMQASCIVPKVHTPFNTPLIMSDVLCDLSAMSC